MSSNIPEDELEIITEKMAEEVHNAWLKKRAKEKGWHHPKDCPVRKYVGYSKTQDEKPPRPCSACHDCMIPFSEVSDKEKELSRSYPAIFIKLLDIMGYDIVKKGDTVSHRL